MITIIKQIGGNKNFCKKFTFLLSKELPGLSSDLQIIEIALTTKSNDIEIDVTQIKGSSYIIILNQNNDRSLRALTCRLASEYPWTMVFYCRNQFEIKGPLASTLEQNLDTSKNVRKVDFMNPEKPLHQYLIERIRLKLPKSNSAIL